MSHLNHYKTLEEIQEYEQEWLISLNKNVSNFFAKLIKIQNNVLGLDYAWNFVPCCNRTAYVKHENKL